jgi:hypothetical protein
VRSGAFVPKFKRSTPTETVVSFFCACNVHGPRRALRVGVAQAADLFASGNGACERGRYSYARRRPEESALYTAIRENLATFLEQADEVGRGLPKHIQREFAGYLRCGVLAHGFVRSVRCDECKEETVVAFSCKGRGVCPSCNTRRAHVTAAHLVDNVLPHTPFRQWTLSFPIQIRWLLMRDTKLLSSVLNLFMRALFTYQRRVARRLGVTGKLECGAVCFTQFFGSALQMTPHFHVLVPEGLWAKADRTVAPVFHELPSPSTEEVERLLLKIRGKVLNLVDGRLDDISPPDDALGVLQAQATQRRFALNELSLRPPKKKPRSAFIAGFSLHADTHIHENDRQALEKLCRYGARGAIALDRLSRRDDGKYVYRLKKASPDGSREFVMTGLELVRKLAALVPPKRLNLLRFFGVFAPGAHSRKLLTKSANLSPGLINIDSTAHNIAGRVGATASTVTASLSSPTSEPQPSGATVQRETPPPKARLNWADLLRRTFEIDIFTCDNCGGRRRVVALINKRSAAKRILEHLGLPADQPRLLPAQASPEQLELVA